MKSPIPVLRIFDEAKAKEFYTAFLGFTVDWEHRFQDGMPLYLQLSKDECIIHLSGYHGDASPGARIRIQMPRLEDYLAQLRSSRYK